MFWSTRSLFMIVVSLLFIACGSPQAQDEDSGSDTAASASAHVVQVVGTEYAFEAPDSIASGWTTFQLKTRGNEPHNLSLVRLLGNHTVDDLKQVFQQGGDPDAVATAVRAIAQFLGGPNSPDPGGESKATLYLEPGRYALICMVPTGGVPHLMMGMARPITVTEQTSKMSEPKADLEMGLSNFTFDFPSEVDAGEHTVRVTNRSAVEPHEVILVQLASGRSAGDFVEFLGAMERGDETVGSPPGNMIGGVSALDPSRSALFTERLEPGAYALICPLNKGPNDVPHMLKGMVKPFEVI